MLEIFIPLAAVLLTGLGYVLKKFVIDPVKEQQKCFEDIRSSLFYYADIITDVRNNQVQRRNEASDKFRNLAASLDAKTKAIKGYGFLVTFKIVKKRSDVKETVGELVGLSNSFFPPAGETSSQFHGRENRDRRNKIIKLLE